MSAVENARVIRVDHPARHGLREHELAAMIGGHWGELLTGYRLFVGAAAKSRTWP